MTTKTDASSKEIFKHLFDQMKKLNSKLISTEEAKAQANLAKQANNVLRYELDRAVAIAKYSNEIKIQEIER